MSDRRRVPDLGIPVRSIPVLLATLPWLAGCAQAPPARAAAEFAATPLTGHGTDIRVLGLGCPQCASNLDLVLAGVPGVASARVDLEFGLVQVEFAPGREPSARRLAEAVEQAGFTVLDFEPRR